MRIVFLIILGSISLFAGCATPDKLSKGDVRDISSLSIAISTTITNDVSGFTDSVDLPINRAISEKLLDLAKTALLDKHYQVADQHVSIGSTNSGKKYYVVARDSDRERNLSELDKKRGPYYSDRLTAEQLALLYKDFEGHNDIPTLGTMGFQGDATLMMQVQGRLIGTDKSIGAALANIAIMTMYIAGGGGSFGGSPELEDTDDTYQVQMRLYSTKSGNILWQSDIKKVDQIENLLQEMARILKERIPG